MNRREKGLLAERIVKRKLESEWWLCFNLSPTYSADLLAVRPHRWRGSAWQTMLVEVKWGSTRLTESEKRVAEACPTRWHLYRVDPRSREVSLCLSMSP